MAHLKSEFGVVSGKGVALKRTARIDLGLSLLHCAAKPGIPLTQKDIAAWCGCTDSAIYVIEERAMRKVRNYLMFRNPALYQILQEVFLK